MVSGLAASFGKTLALAGLEGVSRTTLGFSENEELVYDLEGVTLRVPLHQDRLLAVGLVSASLFTLGVQYSIHKASLRFEAYITAKTAGKLGQATIELRQAQKHLLQAQKSAAKSAKLSGLFIETKNVALLDSSGLLAQTAKGLDTIEDAEDIRKLNNLREALREKAAIQTAQKQAAVRASGWKATGRIGGRVLSIIGWVDLGTLLITGTADLLLDEEAEQDLLGFDIEPWSPLDEYVISPAIDAIWDETPEVIKSTIESTIQELLDSESLEAAQLALLWWFIDEDHISLEGEWPIYLPAKYFSLTLIEDFSDLLSQPLLVLQSGFYLILLKLMAKELLRIGYTILGFSK